MRRISIKSLAPTPPFRPRVGPASIREPLPPGLWRHYCGRHETLRSPSRKDLLPDGRGEAGSPPPAISSCRVSLAVSCSSQPAHIPLTKGVGIKCPAILAECRTCWWATLQTWLRFCSVCITGQLFPLPSCFSFPSQELTPNKHHEPQTMPVCFQRTQPGHHFFLCPASKASGFLWH